MLRQIVIVRVGAQDMTATSGSTKPLPSNAETFYKHYEQMMGIAGDIIYSTDDKGRCTHISPSVEQVLGYIPREVIGVHFSQLVHPEWQDRVIEFYQRQFLNLTPQSSYEFPMVLRSGETCWVEQVVALIVENQKVKGFHAHVHNLNHHKEIEQYLLETADRFFAVAQHARVALFVVQDDRLVFVNTAFERLLERSGIDLINANILEFIHSDDRESIKNALVVDPDLGTPTSHQEGRVLLGNNEIRWIELATNPIRFEYRPAIVGTAFDITDRVDAGMKLKSNIHRLEILQAVDSELTTSLQFDYVLEIALDAAVRITHADAGAIHLVDGSALRVAQVIGHFPETLIGSRVEVDRGIVGRVFRSQQAELVIDVRKDPDYVENVIETRAQITIPLIARDRFIGVLNVQTAEPDIFTVAQFEFLKMLAARIASALENASLYDTSQQQLTELKAVYEKVSALEQMKTQMIRVAAHDLRNPLGVISGYMQMLGWELESVLSDHNREQLSIIQQAVERIDKITRDILTLERVNAKQELPKEQLNLCDIVTTTCKEYRFQAEEKALDFQITTPKEMILVMGDRVLLHETIGNLISNAIKYTPQKGQVWVMLKAESGNAVFEVQDTGYGIPQDQQENLFQPFYRVTLKETKTIKGTGLGLHLVKNIIEQHHGQMHFSSTYEKGSLFGFEIPLAEKSKRRNRK